MASLGDFMEWTVRGGLCAVLVACSMDGVKEVEHDADSAALAADSYAPLAEVAGATSAPSLLQSGGIVPPPHVLSFTATGGGCGPDAKTALSLDAQEYSRVAFGDFTVAGTSSESCKLRFELRKGPTVGVALVSFRVTGRATLPETAVGHLSAMVTTEGAPSAPQRARLDPRAGTVEFTHTFRRLQRGVLPCAPVADGSIEVDLSAEITRAADSLAMGTSRISIDAVRDIDFEFIHCHPRAADPSDVTSDPAPATQPLYFGVRPDVRRCAAPACGGSFVRALNRDQTTCVDGSKAAECYVAELDLRQLGLSDAQTQQLEHERGRLVVLGAIQSSSPPAGGFGKLVAEQAYRGVNETAPAATLLTTLTGRVCVTAPCPTHRGLLVNQARPLELDPEFSTLQAAPKDVERVMSALRSDGVLLSGQLEPTEIPTGVDALFDVTQAYLPVTGARE